MTKERIRSIFSYLFVIFIAVLVAFYFLAGDQIRYRTSRSNIEVTEANTTIRELTYDVYFEQKFINQIDRLKNISFLCTTNYRDNIGVITVKLLHNGELLGSKQYKASEIKDNLPVSLELEDYYEGLVGQELTIQITSNSIPGFGVTPLINSNSQAGTSLYVKNAYVTGSLCFTATGQEFIFTGQIYWFVVVGLSIVFGLILLFSYKKYENGKNSYIVQVIFAIYQYWFLISQLVSRDFKTKYKRSILGVLWSFLNPLLTMLVQYIVFSTIFRSDVQNYPAYLLVGVICFSFFNEVTGMCLQSITGNANLIKKVYMPRYIFPLSRTLSSSVNLGIAILPMLIVSLITGVVFKKSLILILFFFFCLIVFSLGFGMLLSALNVFFRDVQFLWSVVSMMWMYATPIFYTENIIPERFSFIIEYNPIYQFIKNARICLIQGISPEPRAYAYCFVLALISLLFGAFVFKKTQDKFTLYL